MDKQIFPKILNMEFRTGVFYIMNMKLITAHMGEPILYS